MKKGVILLVVASIVFDLEAQVIKLEVNHPFPRVGDGIDIRIRILKDTLDNADSKTFTVSSFKESADKDYGTGTITFTRIIKDTGLVTFGPFTFTINDKKINSDKISLVVSEALPKEKNGIWLRQGTFKGQEYLVMEQRISGEWKTEKTSANSTSSTFVSDNDNFAEIDEGSVDDNQISLNFSYSSSGSQTIEESSGNSTVSYKRTLYKITKGPGFKKSFLLKKDNLKNTDAGTKFSEFIIH